MHRLRSLARVVRDARVWRNDNRAFLIRAIYHHDRNATRGITDQEHLQAAADWLAAAQAVSGDGGVTGRFALDSGWSSSYPETTGYIIPTFLALAAALDDQRFLERARACVDFLLPLQLGTGAFPGMEIAQNRTIPSMFNTAQIIHGLVAWHRATGDKRAATAARKAGDWLLSIQDPDGAFRKHAYAGVINTYSAHASCWIAELGQHTSDERYLASASRHLDWCLTHVDAETGWFDACGFSAEDHEQRVAVTHTIAYTLWGVLTSSRILGRREGVEAVRRAANGIARRIELSGRLPGILDHQWRGRARFACLTGNAQVALIFLRLHADEPDLRLLNAALKAIDGVKAAQYLDRAAAGIHGGIAGSDPPWGTYIYNAIPNWAAKYFVDALLAKRAALEKLLRVTERAEALAGWRIPENIPRVVPPTAPVGKGAPPRVVLYTSPDSQKPAQMMEAWAAWGFRPTCVVVEAAPGPPAIDRLRRRLREEGADPLLRRFRRKGTATGPPLRKGTAASCQTPAELAKALGIPLLTVASLNVPETLAKLEELAPDLAVHAGAGILRAPLLAIPRLGTLNAHMGILPYYRGMNVAEWAALSGHPVGCTVHLINPGIDTGPILCVREVSHQAGDIAELRNAVDEGQIALLGEVVRHVWHSGELPPSRAQDVAEGVQFFRMHEELRQILNSALSARAPSPS